MRWTGTEPLKKERIEDIASTLGTVSLESHYVALIVQGCAYMHPCPLSRQQEWGAIWQFSGLKQNGGIILMAALGSSWLLF